MVMHIIKVRKLIPRPSALRLKMPGYLLGKTSKAWLYDALPGTNKGCTIQTTLDSDLQEYCYSKLKNVCTGNGAGDEDLLLFWKQRQDVC